METEKTEKAVSLLVSAQLTESQVTSAITEFLLKNQEIKDILTDKEVGVTVRWQTTKWSDPNALAHVFITENTADVSDDDAPGDDATPDEPVSASTGTSFFRESE